MDTIEKLKHDCSKRKAWRVAKKEREKQQAINKKNNPVIRAYTEEQKERKYKRQKEYYRENRGEIVAKRREDRLNNPERYAKRASDAFQKIKNDITDSYIIRMLISGTSLDYDDISQEMIKLKRAQIRLLRGIRDVKDNK